MRGARETAELLKAQANGLFHKGKLGAAVDLYTEAFALCPTWTIPLVNRALIHRKNENWERVIEDCQKALSIDGTNMKACYYLGQAYLALSNFTQARIYLKQALESAREHESSIKEEIWRAYASAKYREWLVEDCKEKSKKTQLLDKLKYLWQNDLQSKIQAIDSTSGVEVKRNELLQQYHDESVILESFYEEFDVKENALEPPSWCTCQLTLELFYEPMLAPSGISYEESYVLEHLRKVGKFDPITRTPLEAKDLRKNIGLRNAVEQYLDDHPWAWNFAT